MPCHIEVQNAINKILDQPARTPPRQECRCHRRPKPQKVLALVFLQFRKKSRYHYCFLQMRERIIRKVMKITWVKVVHVSVWVSQLFQNCRQHLRWGQDYKPPSWQLFSTFFFSKSSVSSTAGVVAVSFLSWLQSNLKTLFWPGLPS